MLALYSKDAPPPDGLQNLGSLCIDHIQEPLAFLPINIDEQRIWQRVSNEQGLRGPGRAPVNGMGRGRGSSGERGRGRGRGIGAPYYSRGISYDEESETRVVTREGGPPGMPLRNKSYERSQSIGDGNRAWVVSERNAIERTSSGIEERSSGAVSPQKGRAANENWRSRGSEEKGDTWRGLRSDKWGNRGGWRERELMDGEWEEGGRGQQPPGGRNSSRSWDSEREKDSQKRHWEDDNLPEWATENADDKGGSFDATGAFHAPGSSDEEVEEEEDDVENHDPKTGECTSDSGRNHTTNQFNEEKYTKKPEKLLEDEKELRSKSLNETHENPTDFQVYLNGQKTKDSDELKEDYSNHIQESSSPSPSLSTTQPSEVPVMNGVLSEEERIALCSSPSKRIERKDSLPTSTLASNPSRTVPDTSNTPLLPPQSSLPLPLTTPPPPSTLPLHSLAPNLNPSSLVQSSNSPLPVHIHMERLEDKLQQREEDNLEHMQSVADDLVAKLVDDEPRPLSDGRVRIHQAPPGGFLPSEPISHPPHEELWYYTDPQGDIQGPFSSADMSAWCKAGYFKPSLLLRRECDDKFAQLGDLIKVFGRLPFTPGPPVPPLKVSELLHSKAQVERERYEIMQAQLLQKQLYHQQQSSIRQQQQQQQQQQHQQQQQQQQHQQQQQQQQQQQHQQQVLHSLQGMDDWSNLNSGQQQVFLQQMMTMPPIVPPTMSTSLHTTTTAAAATVSHHQTGVNQELRSSLPSSITPPLAQQPPDPIQAFVAQMTTTSGSNHSISSETPLSQPPQSSSPIGGESPLQKLLLQLQRGSQSGVGGGLTTGGAGPLLPGHIPPSTLGTIPPSSSIGLEKNTPDQYDAIQSLMSQLTKMQMQGPENLQQEDPRIREEEQKRIEEERRLFEEQKRAEEERIKLQQLRLQEERLKEEERRKELEAKNQRLEEELRKIQEDHRLKEEREEEELRRKMEEEEQRRRKEEEQRAREAAEHKRKLEQQQKNAEASKKEEEQRRQQQQLKQKQKQEEEARKREEAKKAEEEERKRKEEQRLKEQQQRIREEKKREEEEKKRRKEEKERQHQLQIQEEMRRVALEEERKRMQQLADEEKKKQQNEEQQAAKQKQQKKAAAASQEQKSSQPAWNTTSAAQDKNVAAPSLAEIQKAQEFKERKEREAEALREAQRQKEAQRQAAEEKKKQEANLKWAARVSQNNNNKCGSKATVNQPPEVPVKSLIEIQKEEEKLMKKRKEREQAERASLNHLTLNSAGVWSSASQSLSWANKAASAAAPVITLSNPQPGPQQAWNSSSNSLAWSAIAQSNVNNTSSGWNSETTMYNQNSSTQNLGGFWESPDTVKYGSGKGQSNTATTASVRSPPKANTANQSSNAKSAAGVQAVNSNKVNKKKIKDENESVKKLFANSISPAHNFSQWCKSSLNSMKVHASIDIPTFVGFLADVESPYEVHDYIRSYLGDSKEVKEFAKQYLERRSKARNAQKEKHDEDNILAPAPAINPVSNLEFQEVKTRLKKGRKKMQKVDSSILGFSLNALERIDVEDAN